MGYIKSMTRLLILFISCTFLPKEASSECVDNYSKCQDFISYCYHPGQWENYMKENCQKSCSRHCPESQVQTSGSVGSISHSQKVQAKVEGEQRTKVVTKVSTSSGSVTSERERETVRSVDLTKCGFTTIPHEKSEFSIDAKYGSWPWMVSINFPGRPSHFCGGSLLSTRWILTASSCLENIRADNIEIIAGEYNRYNDEGAEQYRSVKRIVRHPYYDRRNFKHDIALLELESPVTLTSNVRTICLPERNINPIRGLKCYLPGWGTMALSSTPAPSLQQALLPIADNRLCFGKEEQICAGFFNRNLANPCRGDRGAPLVCQDESGKWVQNGVAGHMMSHCRHYAAFTKLSNPYNIDWIRSFVPI